MSSLLRWVLALKQFDDLKSLRLVFAPPALGRNSILVGVNRSLPARVGRQNGRRMIGLGALVPLALAVLRVGGNVVKIPPEDLSVAAAFFDGALK